MSTGALLPRGQPFLAARDRSLADYAPVFLTWLGFVRQRRANTVRGYGEDLRTFLGFCAWAELAKPGDVTFRHLEFYLGWLQQERGVAARTANRHLHTLRAFWKWMVRERITTTNPAADVFLLPTRRTLPRYLTIPEQERLLALLAKDTSPLGRRDYALVATALLTGLRCSELSNLQLGHLDLEAGVLRVVDGKGRKDRELPIVPRLECILRPYLAVTRPDLLALPIGYIAAPRSAKGMRYWRVLHSEPGGRKTVQVARAGSREEAERLRAAARPAQPATPYVFVRAKAQWLPKHGAQPVGPKTIFYTIRRLVRDLLHRPGGHPHMLRHSFASRLRQKGAPIELISEALGHASITTTMMYAHISTPQRLTDLARLLE